MKIKRYIGLSLSVLLLAPVIFSALATAESSQQVSQADMVVYPDQTPAVDRPSDPAAASQALKSRLAQRKALLGTKLTAIERALVINKCVSAQTTLAPVKVRFEIINKNRAEAYKNVIDNLQKLSDRLETSGVDTAALNNDITELGKRVTTFSADYAGYKQAVDDLTVVDCKTDPEGFRASLDTAREKHKDVVADSAAIRTYVNDTVKPELKQIRTQLQASKPSEGQQ